MDDQIKKTVLLRARLKPVEGKLLRAICSQEDMTISELIRQMIRDRARDAGISFMNGKITEPPSPAEGRNGDLA